MKNKIIYQDSDSIVVAKTDHPVVYDPHGNPHEPLPSKDLYDLFGIDGLWRKCTANGKSASASKTSYPCPMTEHPEHALPNGYNGIWIDEMTPPVVKSCEHEPINVGFARCKMVCKKCDKVLEE